jgi:hypothetical protein
MSFHMRRFTLSGTALVFALTAVGVAPAAHADAPALSLRPAVGGPGAAEQGPSGRPRPLRAV